MDNTPFDPASLRAWDDRLYTRDYLPVLDAPHEAQIVTFRLADSLPRHVVAQIRQERLRLPKNDPRCTAADKWLDAGHGDCTLADPANAQIIRDVLYRDAGRLYTLMAWVIMPNHVHAILTPFAAEPLWSIIQTWKSVSAHRIQRRRGCHGTLWQRSYFDRMIRSPKHLAQAVLYIEHNPVKAGLALAPHDWPWSSAHEDLLLTG
jgi:REP element-mobilizing transposase RayT